MATPAPAPAPASAPSSAGPATSTRSTRIKPPYRQIRAHYDEHTVTVYQAYNATIAAAAVAHQRLDAAPEFSKTRMTWVKPSWSWMLYRAGYSYKDKNQARILALRMKHAHFVELLLCAAVNEPKNSKEREGEGEGEGEEGSDVRDGEVQVHQHQHQHQHEKQHEKQHQKHQKQARTAAVQVQWDPERTPRLGKLEYRSIQIGIRGEVNRKWVDEWIEGIEDVTDRARELKRVIDAGGSDEEVRALCPEERAYEVPDDVKVVLRMDRVEG